MEYVSKEECTVTHVDTSPSELIHSLTDKILVFSHINFHGIDFDYIKLRQFKETRTAERKLRAQDYIIDCFEKNKVTCFGTIRWNTQKLALHNATTLLLKSGFISDSKIQPVDRVDIANTNVSLGHLLSLAWYSILLSTCPKEICIWAKLEEKSKAIILMDLLPGDDETSSRNLNIVRYIIKNSLLNDIFYDVLKNHGIEHIGYGYASKDGSTKDLKNSPPSTILDWITQSFYCKLRCEKIIGDELYEKNIQYSKLADYLLRQKFFLIDTPFRIVE